MNTTENDDELVTSKDVLKTLFKEYGGHKAVAHRFDFSLARAYSFTDPAFPEHNLSFKRVTQLTGPDATAAARYLAQRAGGVFVPLPTTEAVTTVAAISDAVREHGEAIAKTLTALADGKITPDEVPDLVKEIDEAFTALATFRGIVVQAAKTPA